MDWTFLGFGDSNLLKPSVCNFSFAWLADNLLYFSDVTLKPKVEVLF